MADEVDRRAFLQAGAAALVGACLPAAAVPAIDYAELERAYLACVGGDWVALAYEGVEIIPSQYVVFTAALESELEPEP